jgi:hypothetical protein
VQDRLDLFRAERKWLKFAEAGVSSCGIPGGTDRGALVSRGVQIVSGVASGATLFARRSSTSSGRSSISLMNALLTGISFFLPADFEGSRLGGSAEGRSRLSSDPIRRSGGDLITGT